MQITKVTVQLVPNRERLKASASVVFDDCFKVRDILIVPKGNKAGMTIVMPSKKIKGDRYISMAHPITSEFRDFVEKAILDEYEREVSKPHDDQADENPSGEEDDV